ncbi:hypothetical protein [Staphylococcus agnetis]|nr:hypothetical protein [Staphylococcus agnetis]MBY7664730.1 hypothetical protein [Staphylococcus agnetis]NJH67602.1 hypothetical protein [Staphylococcus agnetis]NJH78302.1 hypothetical protein [Staphylococcus agnetis]
MERRIWWVISLLSLIVFIIINHQYRFYNWIEASCIVIPVGIVSYILLEIKLRHKR